MYTYIYTIILEECILIYIYIYYSGNQFTGKYSPKICYSKLSSDLVSFRQNCKLSILSYLSIYIFYISISISIPLVIYIYLYPYIIWWICYIYLYPYIYIYLRCGKTQGYISGSTTTCLCRELLVAHASPTRSYKCKPLHAALCSRRCPPLRLCHLSRQVLEGISWIGKKYNTKTKIPIYY